MPLLAPPTAPPIPQEHILRGQVHMIKAAPRRLAEELFKKWSEAFDRLWVTKDGITPAMRLEALGTNAAEIFDRNTALVTFMVGQFTGEDADLVAAIMAKVATIPAYTAHPDGTVTLD